MSEKQTSKEPTQKLPPIVLVPDESYRNDKGRITHPDVIFIPDSKIYYKFYTILQAEIEKQKNDISGQKGDTDE